MRLDYRDNRVLAGTCIVVLVCLIIFIILPGHKKLGNLRKKISAHERSIAAMLRIEKELNSLKIQNVRLSPDRRVR